MNYYNDNDPGCVGWLKGLVAAGLIPAGDVDGRSIKEVTADDLKGYTQCHFFAGIGGWPLALDYAGWPRDRPVWTGSCPCQPFSGAGRRAGATDERHLWPDFFRLIGECRPAAVFGEQVASDDGRAWLAAVLSDLETLDFACGAADLCAAGVGAPHIRQRLYWVAHALFGQGQQSDGHAVERRWPQNSEQTRVGGGSDRLADPESTGSPHRGKGTIFSEPSKGGRANGGVGDAQGHGRGEEREIAGRRGKGGCAQGLEQRLEYRSAWDSLEWLPCRDGKYRPIEPGTFPLADGIPGRVVKLRGYGNAINPHQAALFVRAAG